MPQFEPPWETVYAVEAESAKDRVAEELEKMACTLEQDLKAFASGSRLPALRGHAERIRDRMDGLLAEFDRLDGGTDQ